CAPRSCAPKRQSPRSPPRRSAPRSAPPASAALSLPKERRKAMAGETIITIVGNLTADPELRYTQNGLPVANFTIASTPRTFDRQANEWKDGEALFLRASVWRDFAEHVAGSLTKGMRVVATGRLKQRSYQDREGNNRTAI